MVRNRIKTEMFVCDNCGNRKRLAKAKRHWCDLCTHGSPVEMHPTRAKPFRSPASQSLIKPPGHGSA